MKIRKILLGIFTLLFVAVGLNMQAQDKEVRVLKQIVETEVEGDDERKKVKVVVIENGKRKKLTWDGTGEMPEELQEYLEGEELDQLIEEVDGYGSAQYRVVMRSDEDGEDEVIEWDGQGEMPARLADVLDENNIDMHVLSTKNCAKSCAKVCTPKLHLGVILMDDQALVVEELVEGKGAARGGVEIGDLIIAVDGVEVEDIDELRSEVQTKTAGETVKLKISRDGKNKNIKVEISDSSADAKACSKSMKSCEKACEKKCDKEMGKERRTQFDESVLPRNSLRLRNFKAFPNPTNGEMNIEFTSAAGPIIVQVLDISGRTVFKDVNNYYQGNYNRKIDLSEHSGKTLILSIIQSEKVYTEKLVVN